MKINPITNPNILRSYQASKPSAAQTQKPSGTRDEVTFSEEARSFSKIMAEAKDKVKVETRSKEEQARISELTDAVRQGRYRVDSDKIADRILESISRGL